MTKTTRSIAALELLLVFPSILFMTSLFVRNLQPLQYEPAHTAQQIVAWYAAQPHLGLWVLLIALPLAVLGIGSATLLRLWSRDAALRQSTRAALALVRANCAALLTAAATLAAAGVIAIVALHLLAD